MAETVKSIFRQREVEKLYQINMVERERYLSNEYEIKVAQNFYSEPLSDKVIGEYNVEIPLLEVGDNFFLHDIEQVVKIQSRMRSSDGSITYYVEDKLVETENTRLSKEKCEAEFADKIDYKNRFFSMQKSYEELQGKFNQYKKEYKYKNRFFNF